MLVGGAPYLLSNRGAEIASSHVASALDTVSRSTYNFVGLAFGAADTNRYLVAVVGGHRAADFSLSSVTIGGVGATLVAEQSTFTTRDAIASIYIAAVPTGTTGDVDVVFSATSGGCGIELYRLVGIDSATPVDTATGSGNPIALNIDVPAGGVLLMANTANTASAPPAAYGVAKSEPASVLVAGTYFIGSMHDCAFADPNRSIGSNVPGSVTAHAVAVASWKPLRPALSADIAMWGDSLTAGNGGGTPIPSQLATALTKTVLNGGISGQRADSIAARQGGIVIRVSVTGNSVPATTSAVNVTACNAFPMTSSGPVSIPGILYADALAIPGTLTRVTGSRPYVSGDYTFTRTSGGSIEPCSPNAIFTPDDAVTYRYQNAIIWAGTNSRDSVSEIVNCVAGMVAHLPTWVKNYLVLSVFNDVTEPVGSGSLYSNVIAANAALAAQYGNRYFDVRSWLIATYGTGPEVASDILPASQLADTIHPNATGKTNITNQLVTIINGLGW